MPWWVKAFLEFLKGFIPAALRRYAAERKRQQAIADQGAADQRQADDAADDEITAEARGRKDATDALSDDAAASQFDRWRS